MGKALGRIKRGAVGVRDTLFERTPTFPDASGSLGVSIEGRTIPYYTVGSGPVGIIFVSAMHGNEVGTTKLSAYLLGWLSDQKQFQKTCTLYVVPCLNPDGQAQAKRHPNFLNDGRIGRFNGRGVDLNRNFPTASFKSESNWTHGKNYQETTDVYCGESPGSEPEISSLASFIKDHGISVYFGFHSAGRDVMGSSDPLGQKLAAVFSEPPAMPIRDQLSGAA